MSKKQSLALFISIFVFILVTAVVLFIGRLSRGFLDPMHSLRVLREYEAMDNDALIKKVKGVHLEADETAIGILADRRDVRLLDVLLDFLTSRFKRRREIALRELSKYNDLRIIGPVMNIVRNKKQNGVIDGEYFSALLLLSKMKHEEAWPYVVELAQKGAPISNGSPNMLKCFEKPEGIPLLKAMEKKIIKSSPVAERVQRSIVEKAIQHLETIQKQKNVQ